MSSRFRYSSWIYFESNVSGVVDDDDFINENYFVNDVIEV